MGIYSRMIVSGGEGFEQEIVKELAMDTDDTESNRVKQSQTESNRVRLGIRLG